MSIMIRTRLNQVQSLTVSRKTDRILYIYFGLQVKKYFLTSFEINFKTIHGFQSILEFQSSLKQTNIEQVMKQNRMICLKWLLNHKSSLQQQHAISDYVHGSISDIYHVAELSYSRHSLIHYETDSLTVWKFRKFSPHAKFFRQIDLQYNSLVKKLI